MAIHPWILRLESAAVSRGQAVRSTCGTRPAMSAVSRSVPRRSPTSSTEGRKETAVVQLRGAATSRRGITTVATTAARSEPPHRPRRRDVPVAPTGGEGRPPPRGGGGGRHGQQPEDDREQEREGHRQ